MTVAELIKIWKAKKAMKQRKAVKKDIQRQNTRSKIKDESSDKSKYIIDYSNVEPFDYIWGRI